MNSNFLQLSSKRNVPAPQPNKQSAHSATAVKDVQAQSQDKAQREAAVTKEVPEKKVPSAEERFEEIKAQGNKHVQKVSAQECIFILCSRSRALI